MNKLNVISIDDERDILTSLTYEVEDLSNAINFETCESAEEALELIDEYDEKDGNIALFLVDQFMPGMKGNEFMATLDKHPSCDNTKVILITGHATHQNTIDAVNTKRLAGYLTKPWDRENLLQTMREILSDYIVARELDALPYIPYLETEKLMASVTEGSE